LAHSFGSLLFDVESTRVLVLSLRRFAADILLGWEPEIDRW
jgi:hypothetical protein